MSSWTQIAATAWNPIDHARAGAVCIEWYMPTSYSVKTMLAAKSHSLDAKIYELPVGRPPSWISYSRLAYIGEYSSLSS